LTGCGVHNSSTQSGRIPERRAADAGKPGSAIVPVFRRRVDRVPQALIVSSISAVGAWQERVQETDRLQRARDLLAAPLTT